MPATTLILPGYGDSGPQHWQSLWAADAGVARLTNVSFDRPQQQQWVEAIDALIGRHGPDVVLVAHSLACLAVAAWSSSSSALHQTVRGALLVAPPDPGGQLFPSSIEGFNPPARASLRFPAIVVGSSNDVYATLAFQADLAAAWGARFVDAGPRGHLNADSGLLDWAEGRALLTQLSR